MLSPVWKLCSFYFGDWRFGILGPYQELLFASRICGIFTNWSIGISKGINGVSTEDMVLSDETCACIELVCRVARLPYGVIPVPHYKSMDGPIPHPQYNGSSQPDSLGYWYNVVYFWSLPTL